MWVPRSYLSTAWRWPRRMTITVRSDAVIRQIIKKVLCRQRVCYMEACVALYCQICCKTSWITHGLSVCSIWLLSCGCLTQLNVKSSAFFFSYVVGIWTVTLLKLKLNFQLMDDSMNCRYLWALWRLNFRTFEVATLLPIGSRFARKAWRFGKFQGFAFLSIW
jgi:hypothetical protein